MEYISTSALSNELDTKTNDLFAKLKTIGWIERKNEKWVLTSLGKQKGGHQLKPMEMKIQFSVLMNYYGEN